MGAAGSTEGKERTPPDWERIELRYRAGLLSLREIAAEDGNVTEGAIRKRAKRDNWSRDLSAKVQQRADELVRKAEVREAVRGTQEITAKVEIEVGAQALADVKMGRKARVTRGQAVVSKLWEEIGLMTDNRENLQKLGELLYAPDEKGRDKLNEIYQAVIATPERVDMAKKLVEADSKLASMEADAWSIKGAGDEPPPPDDPFAGKSANEIARRLAFALHKGLQASQQGGSA